ncbi:hypothetical protein OO014_06140 [Intrasporangium calvum]|uniref:Uncharacterized protein n=1 Tax=Intrasporangium calvum TaxID=53358 RepID=A0ABT5GF22_9MICO|nr:hypothetical protein [Intrasporangium calvum]MDC5696832.1 hypothetical protein [Intrasporangium calvum]
MAGGMGRGRGVPLRDRPVVTPGLAPPPRASRRHCWVEGPADHPGPWPGVIVEWRRDQPAGDWTALVVYVVSEGSTSTTVHTWLSARFLRPADTVSP